MAEHVEIGTTRRTPGFVVASASGPVGRATSPSLVDDLVKLLTDGVPVLLDVGGLRLDWAPAPEAFVTAVTTAGGWPLARLVLFGAGPGTADRLRSCRVTDAVPLTVTAEEAVALAGARPARLSRGVGLPARPEAIPLAREFLRDTCERWGLPDRDDVAQVVTELVTNVVTHAATPARLRLVLDRTGVRVSVRDHRPGGFSAGAGCARSPG